MCAVILAVFSWFNYSCMLENGCKRRGRGSAETKDMQDPDVHASVRSTERKPFPGNYS